MENGVVMNIGLPSSLLLINKNSNPKSSKKENTDKPDKKSENTPRWHKKNPQPSRRGQIGPRFLQSDN